MVVLPGNIDRKSLVNRHNITNAGIEDILALGNGKFCFGADATGLQTFGGNIMCDWAWHSYPLPPGATMKDVPETGTIETGKIKGPMEKASAKKEVSGWMFRNPHRFTMGRIRFIRTGGDTLSYDDITITERELDLWQGIHTTAFKINNKHDAKVRTAVHPTDDIIAFSIESEYFGAKGLSIELSFPYPMDEKNRRVKEPWHGHWSMKDRHSTIPEISGQKAVFRREVDDTQYITTWHWNDEDAEFTRLSDEHTYVLNPSGNSIEFVCVFGEKEPVNTSADYKKIEKLTSKSWIDYWNSGGAVDLSESKDKRWKELERRVVLSQYLMKTQSSG
ncbi:hypothetical protein KA005_17705, partial [bacterium]|nr:hypothetical protein [bacterium]